MIKDDTTYHSLLMEYASGCLDEAHALLVAAHMALSPEARKYIAQYESIGGSMLHDCCPPVEMAADARRSVLEKIKKTPCEEKAVCGGKKSITAQALAVPECLDHYIAAEEWRNTGDGIERLVIKTTCSGWRTELVRITGGRTVPPAPPRTNVATLVLKGALSEESNRYVRGDVIIIERGQIHRLTSDAGEGCVVMIVKPSGLRVQNLLQQALNYLTTR